MSKALIIVDVQVDFCEGGSLAVTGGNEVARKISKHLMEEQADYDLIVASQDWHRKWPSLNEGHFSKDPDFITSWPVHCEENSPGAEFSPYLVLPSRTIPVKKGQGKAHYSAFDGVSFQGRSLNSVLQTVKIQRVDVVGLAFDFCVAQTAVASVGHGYITRILTDMTAGVSLRTSLKAAADVTTAGVRLV